MFGSALQRRMRLILVVMWLAVAALALQSCQKPVAPPVSILEPDEDSADDPGEAVEPPIELPLSPLTGLPMSEETGSPVLVSIDNHPGARPQSNLAKADIVYEISAEGGITRFLALFHSQSPDIVGPVRSARPYFAILAREWNAILSHCGGDNEGLRLIAEWKIKNANEMVRSDLYWRDWSRDMPHNLYTSIANLRTITSAALPDPEPRYEFFDWTESPAAGLSIDYGYRYVVTYKHVDGGYERHVADGSRTFLQKDLETDETIVASNILVQFAKAKVLDSEGRLEITMVGEGKAICLVGGRLIEGTWKKPSLDEVTLFYDDAGQKVSLTPGQTWIQIVPQDAKVTPLTETDSAG